VKQEAHTPPQPPIGSSETASTKEHTQASAFTIWLKGMDIDIAALEISKRVEFRLSFDAAQKQSMAPKPKQTPIAPDVRTPTREPKQEHEPSRKDSAENKEILSPTPEPSRGARTRSKSGASGPRASPAPPQDEKMAQDLCEAEIEGRGVSPERPAKEPRKLNVRGYTFDLPGRCSVCHTDCADEDSLYKHLKSFNHYANTEAWVLEHKLFDDGTVSAMIQTSLYVNDSGTRAFEHDARSRGGPKTPHTDPFADFRRARGAHTTQGAAADPADRQRRTMTMGSGFMRASTQAAEQDKDKADAKIAALQRLANQDGLSHASSDKSQAVFTLGVDELIEFEGRPLEIPCPAYCAPCEAKLENSTVCQRHLTGGPHKTKLKQIVAKLQAKSKPETPTRGNYAATKTRTTSSRDAAVPASSRESAKTFQCAAARCSGVCAHQSGDFEARCKTCNLLQRVPR